MANHKCSTLEVALRCCYCGKYLKETEAFFYYNVCTACREREIKEQMKYNQIKYKRSK